MPSQSSLFVPPPSPAVADRCRFCQCSGNSCIDRHGERCDWTDSTHSCCTAEVCRARLADAEARANKPKPVQSQPSPKPKIKKRRRSNWGSRAAWENYQNR
jgi:hypothetical protein